MNSHPSHSHSLTGAREGKSGVHSNNKPKYLPAWMGFGDEGDGVIINKQPGLRERLWEGISDRDCGVKWKKWYLGSPALTRSPGETEQGAMEKRERFKTPSLQSSPAAAAGLWSQNRALFPSPDRETPSATLPCTKMGKMHPNRELCRNANMCQK